MLISGEHIWVISNHKHQTKIINTDEAYAFLFALQQFASTRRNTNALIGCTPAAMWV